jgi:uncharacterized RDD family membrane protein YckC
VPLEAAPPPPRPRRRERPDRRDHDDCAYDLEDWDAGRRRWIEMMLDAAAIRYVWEGGVLRVARTHQDAVDDMVDAIDDDAGFDTAVEPDVDAGETWEHVADEPPRDAPVVAGPGRRLWGWIVDTVVLQVIAFTAAVAYARRVPLDESLAWLWTVTLGYDAYIVVATARWGRTLGKLAAGTRVVAADDGDVPGWRRSLVRWAVPALVPLALTVVEPDGGVARFLAYGVWPTVVYAPVLWDGWRRGFHDRAAGTVVVAVEPAPARSLSGSAPRRV